MESIAEAEQVRVVRDAYAALDQGDLDAFAAVLSPQVQWEHPFGFGWPLGGMHLGPVAVIRNVFTVGRQGWAAVEHRPVQYLTGPDHVLALGRTSFHAHSGEVDVGGFAHLWLLAEGEVTGVQVFEDTAVALRHRRGE